MKRFDRNDPLLAEQYEHIAWLEDSGLSAEEPAHETDALFQNPAELLPLALDGTESK